MAGWGDDRRIRACVLKALLSGENRWGVAPGNLVDLRGAVVSGDLSGFAGIRLPTVRMRSCRCDNELDFQDASFTGDADFSETMFTGSADFQGASFTGHADFSEAAFTDASFKEAMFVSAADFREAIFNVRADFYEAIFTVAARFNNATFTGTSVFIWATFASFGNFREATFAGPAHFDGTFARHADFSKVTFRDAVFFRAATVSGEAIFDETTFTRAAVFNEAMAQKWSFTSATFLAPESGPWIGSTVNLHRAVFAVRSRISITAKRIDANWLQAPEGAHMLLHSKEVDLSDAEFLRRSILAGPAAASEIPARDTTETNNDDSPREKTRRDAESAEKRLRGYLANELAETPPRCYVTSLARANIGELVLSDVVLDDCVFAGAHGLDKLRIGTHCSFRRSPRWFTRRRMIVEELRWRQSHTGQVKSSPDVEATPLSALEIAEIYRDLRKSLEDSKNEPAAGDFCYGEMEMRRLAGRRGRGRPYRRRQPQHVHQRASYPLLTRLLRLRRIPRLSRLRRISRESTSVVERILLYGYWALSGYGLRASRALLTLIAVIFLAAGLYTSSAFAIVPPPAPQITTIDPVTGAVTYTSPQPAAAARFPAALEFSARESVSLLQGRSTQGLSTRGPGTVLDFVLRLAGPVLLALAVVALRARTKR
jgi:uncharacterized protein YjbI with pentapeptide repeats